jgi:mRNA-degrading endonuclease RelE of RelBE toxin-antitoxin system
MTVHDLAETLVSLAPQGSLTRKRLHPLARMPYKIILAPEAVVDFKALRTFDRATVRDAIREHLGFAPTKTSKSRIKRLRGMRYPEYRLRIEEIRVFYDVTENTVEILAIVPKSEAAAWLDRYGARDEEQSKPDEESNS